MSKDLSHVSDIATQKTNVAGVRTPILEFQPDEGQQLVIHPNVGKGDEPGFPVYGGLQDSSGNDLPLASELAFTYQKPTDDEPTVVTEPRENIRPYRTHPVKDQDNEERIDAFKHVLKGRGLIVRHIDTFAVVVDSSAQIDWSQAGSELYLDQNAVQETPAGVDPFDDGGR